MPGLRGAHRLGSALAGVMLLVAIAPVEAPAAPDAAATREICDAALETVRDARTSVLDTRAVARQELVSKPFPAFGGTGTGGDVFILERIDVDDWFERGLLELENLKAILPRLGGDSTDAADLDADAGFCVEAAAAAAHWRWQSQLALMRRRLDVMAYEHRSFTEVPSAEAEMSRFLRHGQAFSDMASALTVQRAELLNRLDAWRQRAEEAEAEAGLKGLNETRSRLLTCQAAFSNELPNYRFTNVRRIELPGDAFPAFQDPERPELFELSAEDCDAIRDAGPLEFRLVSVRDGAFVVVTPPLRYGSHFFIEARGTTDSLAQTVHVEFRSGARAPEFIVLERTEEPGLWRSELLYAAWPVDGERE